jgi:DegV family protein with EDD domain
MTIQIVTDTLANLPPEIVERYRIPLAPQYVVFGEESYRELFDMSASEFYSRQAVAAELPHTSAPSPGDFEVIYQAILRDDPRATILSIHASAEMSGTMRSALPAAAMFPGADIHVFDTRSASLGLGLMVLEAARLIEGGADLPAVLARLEAMRDAMQVRFVVATLEYLAKGGRIGRAAHLIGSVLDIKPVLAVVDGVVESHAKYRTHKRAVAALQEEVIGDAQGKPGLHLAVMHAACAAEGQAFADALCAELTPEVFLSGELSPAVGAHVGPGTLGVCWWVPAEGN